MFNFYYLELRLQYPLGIIHGLLLGCPEAHIVNSVGEGSNSKPQDLCFISYVLNK